MVGLASCSSGSNPTPSALTVTEKDFSVSVSSTKVAAGSFKVTVANEGAIVHELVVFRTDLDEGSLPHTADDQRIDEEGAGITHLDPEAEGIAPNGSKSITIDLPAGRYIFSCNLPGHYRQGMHTLVTAS